MVLGCNSVPLERSASLLVPLGRVVGMDPAVTLWRYQLCHFPTQDPGASACPHTLNSGHLPGPAGLPALQCELKSVSGLRAGGSPPSFSVSGGSPPCGPCLQTPCCAVVAHFPLLLPEGPWVYRPGIASGSEAEAGICHFYVFMPFWMSPVSHLEKEKNVQSAATSLKFT